MSNFISIIIPVYNDPKGLRDTISTLIENNKALRNYEILVCNDGGGVSEIREFERLILKYDNLKILNIKPNQGSYKARNEGIKKSKGNIIAFLDAGVYVQKFWYDEIIENIEKFDYIAGNVIVPINWAKSPSEIYNAITSFPIKDYFKNHHFGVTANLIINRKVLKNLNAFDERLRSGGDMEFGQRVYDHGLSQIFLENLKVFHYPRNLLKMKKKAKRVLKGVKELIKYYPEKYCHLKNNLNYSSLLRKMIIKLFFPWRSKIYKKGLISYMDFIQIEISLFINKIKIKREIFSEKK